MYFLWFNLSSASAMRKWLNLTGIFAGNLLLLATLLLVSSQPVFAGARTNENGRFYIRNFDYKEYGGHQENWAVVQDSNGIMYFGNNWGVLEYDGASWRLIPTEKETSVLSLDIDSTGTIYVGLENGFGYLAPDSLGQLRFISLETYLPPGAKPVTDVWKIHSTSQGVYFVTITEIYLWAYDSIAVIPITISALSTVLDDTLYYGEWQNGIMRVVDGELQLLPGSESFARVQNFLILPYPSEKTILVGTREQGLLIYSEGEFVPFKTEVEEYIKKNQLYCTLNLPDNQLALGTIRGGVVIIDSKGQLLHKIDKSYGLRDQTIVSMLYDRHGGLWLAQLNGLARVEISTPLTRFDVDMGVTSGINAIIRHQKRIYVGTHRGVSALLPAPQKDNLIAADVAFKPVEGINSFAWELYSDGNSLLAGTDKGIFKITRTKAHFIGGYPYRVRGFVRSKRYPQRIYAALQKGLGVLQKDRGTWTYVGKVQDSGNNEIMTLACDSAGTIWLAEKTAGLLRIKNLDIIPEPDSSPKFGGEISRFGKEHGLPEGQTNVFTIQDRFLFASESGLFVFDEQKNIFRRDSTYGKIFADTDCAIGQVRQDAHGSVWFFARMDDRLLLGAAQPDGKGWFDKPFQRITRIGEVKAILPEENDVVWFGGTEAIVRYRPSLENPVDIDFKTLIRRVSVKDSAIYVGSPLITNPRVESPRNWNSNKKERGSLLYYSHNAMRFEFAATFYDETPANRYQFKLEGFEENWSAWTDELKKDYTNLHEGEYVFKVRAKNIYGTVGQEDSFNFTVLPPWYRSLPAYLFYALTFIFVLLQLNRIQIQRQKKKTAELLEREKEKTNLREAQLRAEAAELQAKATEAEKEVEKEQIRSRIASDLHDEIGSNLSSISIISQMLLKKSKLNQGEKKRIGDINTVARLTAESMRDIIWFVNPVNDSMQKLVARMRDTANVMLDHLEFKFSSASEISKLATELELRRNLYLIYKEALQNIVKHAEAENVEISVDYTPGNKNLALLISDDGIGFETDGDKHGNGLKNFAKRANAIGGVLKINSKPDIGTTITLNVKIP